MSKNYVLSTYERLLKYPFGRQLFSWFTARKAPYFKTISPLVTQLRPNHCEVLFTKRNIVQNHIGTVHVIAICNGLEMAMGFMCEASVPKHLRWIPKGMEVQYPAKADTDIRCVAEVADDAWKPGNLPIDVKAYDTNGNVVVCGTITVWVSENRPSSKDKS
ncbi:MAG: hotdog fold domain-containing protein [Glaciecola sp.]|nr:hotdog fold domain-containing protein [Glaciecola sp.]MDG2099199.1 hotdog fold domain-containing protein [Glaciecola sp.]